MADAGVNRALATLARLRQLEADQARRVLGETTASERAAEDAAAEARWQRAQETERARAHLAQGPADPVAGAYAAWLPAAARLIAAADSQVTACQAERALAAAALIGRRAACDAVDTLIANRDGLKRRQAARRAQASLDEFARRSAASGRAGPPSDPA